MCCLSVFVRKDFTLSRIGFLEQNLRLKCKNSVVWGVFFTQENRTHPTVSTR